MFNICTETALNIANCSIGLDSITSFGRIISLLTYSAYKICKIYSIGLRYFRYKRFSEGLTDHFQYIVMSNVNVGKEFFNFRNMQTVSEISVVFRSRRREMGWMTIGPLNGQSCIPGADEWSASLRTQTHLSHYRYIAKVTPNDLDVFV